MNKKKLIIGFVFVHFFHPPNDYNVLQFFAKKSIVPIGDNARFYEACFGANNVNGKADVARKRYYHT